MDNTYKKWYCMFLVNWIQFSERNMLIFIDIYFWVILSMSVIKNKEGIVSSYDNYSISWHSTFNYILLRNVGVR